MGRINQSTNELIVQESCSAQSVSARSTKILWSWRADTIAAVACCRNHLPGASWNREVGYQELSDELDFVSHWEGLLSSQLLLYRFTNHFPIHSRPRRGKPRHGIFHHGPHVFHGRRAHLRDGGFYSGDNLSFPGSFR